MWNFSSDATIFFKGNKKHGNQLKARMDRGRGWRFEKTGRGVK